ncbi:response regulator transcription factor [Streptomyces sp. WMMB303]|uniref:LuxR C-terminal-related transcriptional regulator n=1 Tax=Streptomyces sp. WMMB303 TaxID=3034154 RepID=UPI0023EAD4BE|nr:response regulator transcription factor [Streptomyces sp. WMMB303]MDF4250301.1 response regulator transcription factor [Streptomyces sp. WMMB303]
MRAGAGFLASAGHPVPARKAPGHGDAYSSRGAGHARAVRPPHRRRLAARARPGHRLGGIEATRRITEARTGAAADPKVLVLTTFDLGEYVFEALRAGASGLLLKDASAAELADAVRVVARGEALLAPNLTKLLIEKFAGMPDGPGGARLKERVADLTERETEVLALVARGLSNLEIAGELVVAEQTVKTHVSRILVKLGLRDRTQAAVFAYETGLVRPGRR